MSNDERKILLVEGSHKGFSGKGADTNTRGKRKHSLRVPRGIIALKMFHVKHDELCVSSGKLVNCLSLS
jgi:hypothetical protein